MNVDVLLQQFPQFLLVYVLLLVVIAIAKLCGINQSKMVIVSSMKMTVQLILAGFVLTAIFDNPHFVYLLAYLLVMVAFAVHRVISKNPGLNRRFKWVIALSMAFCGGCVLVFFVGCVVRKKLNDPQYMIPIFGMLMGNAMTAVGLGVKTFRESLSGHRDQINALLCFGASPRKILLPFARQAMETAMLPTLNSMAGMGIVALPGMMTGQILSGTLPFTAILYQISIMVAICTTVTGASFGVLYFGYHTLYDSKTQIL